MVRGGQFPAISCQWSGYPAQLTAKIIDEQDFAYRQRTPRTSSRDPKKKLNKEEMAKTPCIYFARGDCRRGDKCLYLHEKKSAAAPKDPAQPNSPKPKKEPKPKKSATPCVRDQATHAALLAASSVRILAQEKKGLPFF